MSAPDPMPAASPTADELLEVMLHGHGLERIAAWGRAMSLGFGGYTVIDRCNPELGNFGWTIQSFRRHLFNTDSTDAIDARGYRLHTTRNVELGALADVDRGPALGAAR